LVGTKKGFTIVPRPPKRSDGEKKGGKGPGGRQKAARYRGEKRGTLKGTLTNSHQ